MENNNNNSTDESQLVEIPIGKSNVVRERKTNNDNTWRWICCTFRVRLIGIIALFLLQVPIIGYYYASSEMYMTKFSNSYGGKIFGGVFGMKFTNLTEVKRNSSTEIYLTSSTVINDSGLHLTATTNLPVTLRGVTANSSATRPPPNPTIISKTSTSVPTNTTATAPITHQLAADGSILEKCPPEPPNLQGRLAISFDKPPKTFEQTLLDNPLLTKGGHAKPPLCVARHKVAIIIPYRDRVEHLRYFVQYMHPILQRQELDYQIFIVNQMGTGKFNRAKLMNIGFLEALKVYPFQCFSFHDVDLVLEDDRSLYWCSDRPRHMSAGVDKFNYVLPYGSIFGGVTLITKEQMENINGFSNQFWGWGGEDDDVYNRLRIKGYKIVRYPMEIARYKMIRHEREKGNEPNPKRFEMIGKTKNTYQTDGLNSIKYKVTTIDFQPTYTNITVDVMGP